MTDRINAITVVLDEDIREDDAYGLLSAIRQLRGVLSVQPHVAQHQDLIAYSRARRDLEERLLDALRSPNPR